jgi:predicted pyridoxine 5'-phosphate oxidase superfamily flavin-nucleotide-binding protein
MLKKIKAVWDKRDFVSVATCSPSGHPNAAPKFFLKIEGAHLYLIDYTLGRTWENIRVHPYVSISFMDTDSLIGYQVNGTVKLIAAGEEFEKIFKELLAKEVDLSTRRIIEGVTKGEKHKNFELAISNKFVILKVNIKEIVAIGTNGEIKHESVEE